MAVPSGLGDIVVNKLLSYYFEAPSTNPFATVPSQVWLGLSTSDPLDTGVAGAYTSVTEPPAANGYARIALTTGNPTFGSVIAVAAPDGTGNTEGSVALHNNAVNIVFGPVTGVAWPIIKDLVIFDSAVVGGGNILVSAVDTVANSGVPIGDTFTIAPDTGFVSGIYR